MEQSKKRTSFYQDVKILRLVMLIGVFILSNFQCERTFAAKVDSSFNPEILREATINSIAVQSNGKIIVAGDLLKVGTTERNYVARFNSDGSLDESFNPGTLISRAVSDIAIQPDGKIILVGRFLPFNGRGTTRIVRLNEDGSIDETFNSGTGVNGTVSSVQISNQSNGKILIGGGFTEYNGVIRNRIARLNSDGSLDTTFNPNAGANSTVRDLRVQPDGKVIIVGEFATYNGTSRNRIARLNNDGTLDTSFNPGTGFNSAVICLELQTNGNILAGGAFTTFNGASRNRIAQLSSTGGLTTSFAGTGANGSVWEIALGANGNQIYLGGGFTTYNQLSRNGIVIVDSTGVADANLNQGTGINLTNPNLLPKVLAIKEVNSGNGILFGGIFQTYNGTSRVSLARTSMAGILSPTFDSPVYTNGSINAVFTQSNGKILISGNFYLINGTTRNRIARLNSDGSLDNSFDPGTATDSFFFTARAIQPDGRIYIDGSFTSFNGVTRNRVARLNADGSVDLTFNPNAGPNSGLNDIKIQSDGKVIVVGFFTNFNGVARSYIARLNSDGSLDTSSPLFNPSTNNNIVEAKFDNNGGILLVGDFTNCNGTARNRIARINALTGALDTNFNPGSGANSEVYSIGTDRNEIVNANNFTIGGEFTQYNGVNVGRLAKLQANGTLDLNFNANAGSGLNFAPYVTRIQSDGRIITVGTFSSYAGIERGRIVRINQNGNIDSTFNPRSGASDFINYLALGSNEDEVFVVGDFSRFSCSRRTGIAKLIPGSDSTCQEVNSGKAPFDFDGDNKSDISVFRPDNGAWYIQQSTNGSTGIQFGLATDKLVPADYDGDGKTDVAVYRNGIWYLQRSVLGFTGIAFGDSNDIPVPADYDGDGKADVAVFRPSNGVWYLLRSSLGFTGIQFGQNGDKPVPADYDGDGKADIAVNRNGIWYIQRSQLGFFGVAFGDANDKLVPADYDGDGKADVAVFRPSNGVWYLLQSQAGFTGIAFGLGTDVPVAADYDGDGKADVAVFRNGTWYLNRTTAGFTGVVFGLATDKPIPNVFVP